MKIHSGNIDSILSKHKYMLYFSFDYHESYDKIKKSIPFLSNCYDDIVFLNDGEGRIVSDSKAEILSLYNQLECDNPKEGCVSIYASYWEDGYCIDENT